MTISKLSIRLVKLVADRDVCLQLSVILPRKMKNLTHLRYTPSAPRAMTGKPIYTVH